MLRAAFFLSTQKPSQIAELIIAFLFFSGSVTAREHIFVCFEITIFNFKHETTTERSEREGIRNVHITGSILMINGLLHFFLLLVFFFFKKKLFCIQEYKKPISLPKRKENVSRKTLQASPGRESAAFFFFLAPCSPFFLAFNSLHSQLSSRSLKLYKSVFYWSLYRLLMLPIERERHTTHKNDEFIFVNLNVSHKLLFKLPFHDFFSLLFFGLVNRSLITDKAECRSLNKMTSERGSPELLDVAETEPTIVFFLASSLMAKL